MRFRSLRVRLRKWRQWRTYLLVVLFAYGLTHPSATLWRPFRVNLENLVFDQYQRWLPRPYDFDQPVRIVDIDDESIRHIGRWPWPRQTMAELVEALTKAGSRGDRFRHPVLREGQADRRGESLRLQRVLPHGRSGGALSRRRGGWRHRLRPCHRGPPRRAGERSSPPPPTSSKRNCPQRQICLTSGTIPPSSSIASTGRSSQSPCLPRPRGVLDISTGCPTTRPGRAQGAVDPQHQWARSSPVFRWRRCASRGARRPMWSNRPTASGETSGKSARVEAVEVGDVI